MTDTTTQHEQTESRQVKCDLCSTVIVEPGGYQLTTTQVVRSPRFWRDYYQRHREGFAAVGISSYDDLLDSPARTAVAEQIARDKTWYPGLEDESEILFQVPPDPVNAKKSLSGSWPGAKKVDLGAFRPADIPNLFVLGGCADISRNAAEKLTASFIKLLVQAKDALES